MKSYWLIEMQKVTLCIISIFVHYFPLHKWYISIENCTKKDLRSVKTVHFIIPSLSRKHSKINGFKLIFLLISRHYLKNSVLINGLAVLLVILVSIMASFACRRMNWKLRIERACTYLEQNYLKTYEIAYRVGFRDEKYFSRVFKKVKGMSPKEYRTGNSQEPA